MDIREQYMEAVQVIGIATKTSNSNESNPETARLPALWQRFFSESTHEYIPNKIDECNILGVYTSYDIAQRGEFTMIAGCAVSSATAVPDGLVGLQISPARYLVFSERGEVPAVIYSLWENIRKYFATTSQYQRLYSTDFEQYNMNDMSTINIYVAVSAENQHKD